MGHRSPLFSATLGLFAALALGCGLLKADPCDDAEQGDSCAPDPDPDPEADADADADGDSDSDGDADAPVRYSGSFTSLPHVVRVPELDLSAPPLVTVYLSTDDGASWFVVANHCNGGFAQVLRDGEIELRDTYCTRSPARYQIALQPAAEVLEVTRDGASARVATSRADTDAVPLLVVYNSSDGVEWHIDHGTCGQPNTWQMSDGEIVVQDTYCSGDRYLLSFATPTSREARPFASESEVVGRVDDPEALPVLTPYFGSESADWLESTFDCGSGNHNLLVSDGGDVTLSTNFCTPSGRYALAVGR